MTRTNSSNQKPATQPAYRKIEVDGELFQPDWDPDDFSDAANESMARDAMGAEFMKTDPVCQEILAEIRQKLSEPPSPART